MIQSLQTDNDQLEGKFNILEKDTANLTYKIQSMTKGAERLSERISAVEFINQTLSKGYDRLADRMSFQKGNMHGKKLYPRMRHYLY